MVYLIEHQGATTKTYSGKLLHDPNMMDRTEVKQTMVRISTNLEEEKNHLLLTWMKTGTGGHTGKSQFSEVSVLSFQVMWQSSAENWRCIPKGIKMWSPNACVSTFRAGSFQPCSICF